MFTSNKAVTDANAFSMCIRRQNHLSFLITLIYLIAFFPAHKISPWQKAKAVKAG
jgi:hypothetical protein